MAKVKYAIIGFGGIAENRVAKEGYACDKARFAPLKSAELVGAYDLFAGRKDAAKALGLKWYDSIDAILADKEIDAVYVATNNASHAEIAIKAMEAGKHVIVEKPIATKPADAKKMVDLAAKKKLCLSVDHMMVYNAYNVMAKKYVRAGKLGDVNDCCFHMEFAYGYDPAEAATWRCSKIEEMGGPIGDVASHCFYVAEYIFGSRIVEVSCCYLPKTMNIVAEDGAYVKFTMANGMKGSVRSPSANPAAVWSVPFPILVTRSTELKACSVPTAACSSFPARRTNPTRSAWKWRPHPESASSIPGHSPTSTSHSLSITPNLSSPVRRSTPEKVCATCSFAKPPTSRLRKAARL